MRRHLVLFVRAPELGHGKRRLAREIGDVATVRFERLMLALLLRRLAADRRWRLRIAATPDKARRHARQWRRGIDVSGQGGGDLGVRMRRALAACPPGPVVLVGGDIPALAARHVATAFHQLGGCDLVFGPAKDGGFWLVGARRRPRLPPLFEQSALVEPLCARRHARRTAAKGDGRFYRSPRRCRRRRGLSPPDTTARLLISP